MIGFQSCVSWHHPWTPGFKTWLGHKLLFIPSQIINRSILERKSNYLNLAFSKCLNGERSVVLSLCNHSNHLERTTRALVSPFTNIAFNVCRCGPSSGFQSLNESNEQLRLGAFMTGQQWGRKKQKRGGRTLCLELLYAVLLFVLAKKYQ
jgi:hypothetical protein